MSWINDVFDSANNNKDPFVRFLFRLTFSVVFIVLVFFAYNIITGNSVTIAGFNFAIRNKDTTNRVADSKPSEKYDSVKKSNYQKKPDSPLRKNNIPPNVVESDFKPKLISSPKQVTTRPNKPTKVEKKEEPFQINRLRKKDMIKAENIIYGYVGRDNSVRIDLSYWEPDLNSVSCTRQLYDYLISKGYTNVRLLSDGSESEVSGFWIAYDSGQYARLTLFVGMMDEDRREFRVMGHMNNSDNN